MGDSMGWLALIGGLLIAAVLAWAIINNRRSAAARRQTEAATHDLYQEIDREDKANHSGPSRR
jgi:ABC-type nickel/cobalt efflux system permease component RcnA